MSVQFLNNAWNQATIYTTWTTILTLTPTEAPKSVVVSLYVSDVQQNLGVRYGGQTMTKIAEQLLSYWAGGIYHQIYSLTDPPSGAQTLELKAPFAPTNIGALIQAIKNGHPGDIVVYDSVVGGNSPSEINMAAASSNVKLSMLVGFIGGL